MSSPRQTASRAPLRIRMLRAVYEPLSQLTRHPLLNVFVGIGLLLVGIDEFLSSVDPDYEGFLELHHAITLVGLTTLLHGLIGFVERFETVLEHHEAMQGKDETMQGEAR
jgi:hypothetical protein